MSYFRDLMMAQGGGEVDPWLRYSQDGLVLQLDCAKNCTATSWTDLIGGLSFDVVGTMALDSDGVPTYDGTSYYYRSNKLSFSNSLYAIEVVFLQTANQQGFLIQSSGNLGFNILADPTTNRYILAHTSRNGYNSTYATYGELTSFSDCHGTFTMANGSLLSYYTSQDFNSVGSGTGIGSRGNSSAIFVGKIYAVRIYRKTAYSQTIAAANQAIDLERWG